MKLRLKFGLGMALICGFWIQILFSSAIATSHESWLNSSKWSDNTVKALTETFPEHTVQSGNFFEDYEDGFQGAMVILTSTTTNLVCILEKQGEDYQLVAVNDKIIPERPHYPYYLEGLGWIVTENEKATSTGGYEPYYNMSDTAMGVPYFEYKGSQSGANDFFLDIDRNEQGKWIVREAEFSWGEDASSSCGIRYANQETALNVRLGGNWFLHVPCKVDLHFENFDPKATQDYLYQVASSPNEPYLIPSTGKEGAIPQGVLAELKPGQAYPVYTGPGKAYAQGESEERELACVQSPQWIQIYGHEGDWLLIQYHVSGNINRFGYISSDAIATEIDVPELAWLNIPTEKWGWITFDPLRSAEGEAWGGENPEDKEHHRNVTLLATMGDEWWYMEATNGSGQPCRGFSTMYSLPPEATEYINTVESP